MPRPARAISVILIVGLLGSACASAPEGSADLTNTPSAGATIAPEPTPATSVTSAPTRVPSVVPSASATRGPTASPAPSVVASPSVTAGGRWLEGAPAPVRRAEFSAAVLDGKLYVAGGFDALHQGEDLSEVDVYDPVTDTWSSVAPLPLGTDHGSLVTVGAELIYLGGLDGGRNTKDVWRHTTVNDTWTKAAPMPGARSQFAAAVVDGKVYVVGGVGPGLDPTAPTWAYDPGKDRWADRLAPIPTARNHLAAVPLDGRIWAIGGRWDFNAAAVESYDPATDSWRTEAPLPTRQGALAAGIVDGQIHVTGGEDLETFTVIALHQVYDPISATWSRGPDLPVGRHGLGSGVIDDRWIVVGGGPAADYAATDRVDIFEP